MSPTDRSQALRVLDSRFRIDFTEQRGAIPAGDWLAVVQGPDGQTVVRPDDPTSAGAWAAFWSGDEPHDPQATGMLSAIVAPLADAGLPVMVVSTFHADLVLVPADRVAEAIGVLRAAGHRLAQTQGEPSLTTS